RLFGDGGEAPDTLLGAAAVGLVAAIQGGAAARHREGVDLEPAPLGLVEQLDAGAAARAGRGAQRRFLAAARQRGKLVPEGRALELVAPAPRQALGGAVGVGDAPV